MSAKCDYCGQPGIQLTGETNGVLVCIDHAAKVDTPCYTSAEVERLLQTGRAQMRDACLLSEERRQNALEMSRRAEQAERRAEDAEAVIEATRDLLDGWENDGPEDPAIRLLIQRVREMLALGERFRTGRQVRRDA